MGFTGSGAAVLRRGLRRAGTDEGRDSGGPGPPRAGTAGGRDRRGAGTDEGRDRRGAVAGEAGEEVLTIIR